jgi:hypothetical protein
MKMNDLNFYEAPKMDVLELELEQAVLQASMGGEGGSKNDPFGF